MRKIAKKAKVAGVKVNQELRSQLSNINRKHRKRLSIQALRRDNVRADLMILPAAGEQVLFRISNRINLSKIREQSKETIDGVLSDLEIKFWQFPVRYTDAHIFHVMAEDRPLLLDTLVDKPELSHWQFQVLRNDGKPKGGPRLLRELKPSSSYPALRIFERVAYSSRSSFRSGPSQGVEIHFWRPDVVSIEPADCSETPTAMKVVMAPVWNRTATVLPDFNENPDQFERSLTAAKACPLTDIDFEIDAVFTWVDGSDREWQERKAHALNITDSKQFVNEAVSDARFADHDELRYSLRSISQFAPWIRKIWIVTSGQVPSWLDTSNPRVVVVNHDDIWPDTTGLPNFNSHAIESNLHRIEGLSEHYLYFNDDFFLTRPSDPSLFYYGNGVSKVFFSKALVGFEEISSVDNASTIAAKNARTAITQRGLKTFSQKFFHTPSALRKSVIQRAEEEFSEWFRSTRNAQFREQTDIAVAGSFYFNYAMAIGAAVPGSIRYDYIDPATGDGRNRMKRLIRQSNKDCIVVNDGSTIETESERIQTDAFIREALRELIPAKSEFEK